MADTINFDADNVGSAPSGWTAGVTGRGTHRWTIEAEASAPSKPNVLKQSGTGARRSLDEGRQRHAVR